MSINEGLNARAFGAEMSSNQFGTDGRSLQLDETLLEEKHVHKVLGTSLVDGKWNSWGEDEDWGLCWIQGKCKILEATESEDHKGESSL